MRLVLCHREDEAALWAWRGLGGGRGEIELVTADELMDAARWEHRIGEQGTGTIIELADGRTIDSATLRGVLCRLTRVPVERLPAVSAGDREYATQELWAFWLSWLAGLPDPMVGRPSPQGLSGPWLAGEQWLVAAARAGLRTGPVPAGWAAGPPHVLVAGGAVIGRSAPAEVVRGCGALAELVAADLLGVRFTRGWEFAGATSMPDLRAGGAALLKVLAKRLGSDE